MLAGCGSSATSSSKPGSNDVYSVAVSPTQLTLNAGDWAQVSATVDLSHLNSAPKPISPQPAIVFLTSDTRVNVSPSGQVCAGQWDSEYQTCSMPAGTTPPTGYVYITANDPTHNVSNTIQLSVHQRAASITLTAPGWTAGTACLTENTELKYDATPLDANGNKITNVYDNDYTWSVADPSVAAISTYGYVLARNPGVTSVYAKLNGTVSEPLVFATCPPAAIKLVSSPFTNGTPLLSQATTADLNLNKGAQKYMTAIPLDKNGNPLSPVDQNGNSLNTLPLTFVTSNRLSGTFTTVLPLTSGLTASTSGDFAVAVACEPSTCNTSVANFVSPAGEVITAEKSGFGFPIYSNIIGVTVQGISGSNVLVAGATFTDGVTPAHRLLTYDSESLQVTHTIALANVPNSLVVAPNGQKAYLGSSAGLVVVDLTTFQSSTLTYPVSGGQTNPQQPVTGTVLGVSPDSRYVVVSDLPNGLLFLIDTTGTKNAVQFSIPGIRTATFAADLSNFWIAGDSGVYTYSADTFIPITALAPADAGLSTNVKALAWMPDGQSYFAGGDQIVNYSTCDNLKPSAAINLPISFPSALSMTSSSGVPHLLGLSGTQWFDYPLTTTAQIGNANPQGNVCLSTVTIDAPSTAVSTLQCTPTQITFGPTQDTSGSLSLPREFITGVDPSCASPESVIHGYDVKSSQEITVPTISPVVPLSGGLLNDGRKLYFGTYDSASQTALLHRINFDPTAGPVGEDTVTTTTGSGSTQVSTVTIPAPVQIVPSFVAVVPK
jgi:hypothetical protein